METLTLDIGCGDRPQGDINADLLTDESLYFEERKVDPKRIRNFVRCDAHYLPFRRVFQWVKCFHTLEHLRDPEQAVREMTRVVNGVVEIRVPVSLHERFQCWFVPKRREWVRKHHKHRYTMRGLRELFPTAKIRYNYFILHTRIYSLKQLFYQVGSTFFPPFPDELRILINTK